MKVFGYTRISIQNDEGVSLAHQADRIRTWAAAHGHEVAQIFTEVRSAGRADNRPELLKCISAVCKAGGIMCIYSLSRLSRNVRDTLALSDRLNKAGAHLCSLSENLDTTSAMSVAFFQIASVMCQLERGQLKERTLNAMGHLRRQNRRISSKIPMGYELSRDGITLLPNHPEQAVIARIVERRTSGMTLGAIARSMVAEGVATKQGGQWTPKTVLAILRRQEKLAA
jgi:DNA invertase Pin-like site-specific DNA recombinase